MNCPQCQAANGPDAVFCSNCGTGLAAARGQAQSGAPAGGAGYGGPAGYGTPAGNAEPTQYGAPTQYGMQAAYPPPPGGGNAGGYAAASGSAPAGYPGQSGPAGAPGYPGQPGSAGPSGYPGPSGPGGPSGAQGPASPWGPQGQYAPGQSGGYTKRPVNWDLARLTLVDKIIAVATLVTMISLWLPWFTASDTFLGVTNSVSVSGTGQHSWLWLEFLVALALIAYLVSRAAWDEPPVRIPVAHEILLIAATGLQFLLILIGFLAKPSAGGVSVGWGFGAFLAVIASIVAAAPVIYPAVKAYLDKRKGAAPRTY